MKTEHVLPARTARQKQFQEDSSAPFAILCDAIERPLKEGTTQASKEELETLVTEVIGEALRGKTEILEEDVRAAILEAHKRVRAACSGEESPPVVSVVVTTELPGNRFLLAGAGDCQVFGLTVAGQECLFEDPEAISAKGKSAKRSTSRKNRLGANEALIIHTHEVAATPFRALIALTFGAYSRLEDDKWRAIASAEDIASKLKPYCRGGDGSVSREAIVVQSGQGSSGVGKKRSKATPMLVAATIAAALCLGLWIRSRGEPAVEPIKVVQQEASIDEPVIAAEILSAEEYEAQMAEVQAMIDAELAAQEQLLEQHKTEMVSFREEAEAYQTLREDFVQLSDLFAEETLRMRELEGSLEQERELFVASQHELASKEDLLATLQEELTAEQGQREEQALRLVSLEARASELEAENTELVAQVAGLRSTGSEYQTSVVEQLERIEELEMKLSDAVAKSLEFRGRVEELEGLEIQRETVLSTLEDDHLGLLDQLETLSERAREQEFAVAAAVENKEVMEEALEETKLALVAAKEEKGELEIQLAQLSEQLNNRQVQLEETMLARTDVGSQLDEALAKNEELRLEKEGLLDKVALLEGIQNEYVRERELRQDKDEMLAKLTASIDGWKAAVAALERSRLSLAEELVDLRSYQEGLAQGRLDATARAAKSPARAREKTPATRIHLVSPGESLESISRRYASDVSKILDANQDSLSNGEDVRVGTALVIP